MNPGTCRHCGQRTHDPESQYCDNLCRMLHHEDIQDKAEKAIMRETREAKNPLGLELL